MLGFWLGGLACCVCCVWFGIGWRGDYELVGCVKVGEAVVVDEILSNCALASANTWFSDVNFTNGGYQRMGVGLLPQMPMNMLE